MSSPTPVQSILAQVEAAHAAMAARANATTDHEDFIDLTGRTEGLADALAIVRTFLPRGYVVPEALRHIPQCACTHLLTHHSPAAFGRECEMTGCECTGFTPAVADPDPHTFQA